MQIRTRLTFQFILLGGIIMIIASVAIYISSARFRSDDFYNRLRIKSRSTAKIVFNAFKIDAPRVLKIEKDNLSGQQNDKIIILDFKNDIVYSSDENNEIEIRNDVLERVRLGKTVSYKQGMYQVSGTLYHADLDRYVVIAAGSDELGALHLNKLKNILIIVCLSSLLLFFIAGWFYSGRALKPMSDVIERVEDISITSLNLRVPTGNGTDEIGRLAKTFNKMLERLESSFAMQKDFISNASHELRTPLTSINGQLEVLMLKDRSTDEYKAALGSVLEDIKSLINLSNRLLLIARTSSEGSVNFNHKVRIDEILWLAQEDVVKYNNNYHINISIDNQMIVVGDESLLKVAVSNIIENGCKYSTDNTVEIKFRHSEKWIEIEFEDRGIGIPEEDLQKIFEPFYRGSNTMSVSGSGIGLPLVNQIVKNHKGTIKLTSQVGKGTKVIVILPAIS
jgi:signal transduction histidine kinase